MTPEKASFCNALFRVSELTSYEPEGDENGILYIEPEFSSPLEMHFSIILVVAGKLAFVGSDGIQNQSHADAEAVDEHIFLADVRHPLP